MDDLGANGTGTATVTITEKDSSDTNVPPTADAGRSYSGTVNEKIMFTGYGTDTDGTIAYYRWDFDTDGSYDTEWSDSSIANHSYTSAGIYTVTLQVMDDLGANGTGTATVTITGDGGIPGFELVLVFCALIIVFYIIRKRRNM
jgi:PKD repeat protein